MWHRSPSYLSHRHNSCGRPFGGPSFPHWRMSLLVYAAVWCKLKVHAWLEEWIKTDSCPLCGAKKSVQHALTQCRVMPLVHDPLHRYYRHVCIQRGREEHRSHRKCFYTPGLLPSRVTVGALGEAQAYTSRIPRCFASAFFHRTGHCSTGAVSCGKVGELRETTKVSKKKPEQAAV